MHEKCIVTLVLVASLNSYSRTQLAAGASLLNVETFHLSCFLALLKEIICDFVAVAWA